MPSMTQHTRVGADRFQRATTNGRAVSQTISGVTLDGRDTGIGHHWSDPIRHGCAQQWYALSIRPTSTESRISRLPPQRAHTWPPPRGLSRGTPVTMKHPVGRPHQCSCTPLLMAFTPVTLSYPCSPFPFPIGKMTPSRDRPVCRHGCVHQWSNPVTPRVSVTGIPTLLDRMCVCR